MMNNCAARAGMVQRRGWLALLCLLVFSGQPRAEGDPTANLPDTVTRVKASVVGVGTYQRTARPPARLLGTGFVVGDGRHVLTNLHVVSTAREQENLVVFIGRGPQAEMRLSTKAGEDADHDLALLKIADAPLPALTLGDSDKVREGETYAFTGFPIGAVLGLYPATHRGLIAAVTPMAVPLNAARELTPALVRRLQSNYLMFQLDATAYPGNSGSPMYDPASGAVMGIINKVFVREIKESVLEKPSGISYAIPINHARALLEKAGLQKK